MKEVNVLYEFKSFKKYRSENKTEKAEVKVEAKWLTRGALALGAQGRKVKKMGNCKVETKIGKIVQLCQLTPSAKDS